ncbi:MAG: FAD-dependent oxidoreductase [Bacteroidales bacterium]|nr:FAD-dependent oxidoreductase [Bacteroidales bacterium]
MKNNRRTFIKAMGLGSGALMINPLNSLNDRENGIVEIDKDVTVFARRQIETEILIAGGGMSGVCAALAAARNGNKVVLIQNRSRLGGNASSEIRMHICGATALNQVWRETGILEELMLTESVTNPQVSHEMLDYVLYDKVFSEKNITLLLDTIVFDVQTVEREILSVKAICSQTEELYDVSAKCFADCTGDGTLAALAGAEFMSGREAREKWGESLGQDKPDDITMGNSLLFQARKHDKVMPFIAPSWARKYTAADFVHRKINSYEYGYWWLELGGVDNIINDGQRIRNDLMAVVFGVWDYIKNSGDHPGSANWALSWFGMIPGKRESRRITGDYIIIQKDILAANLFDDRVAYGGWPLDDHLPRGMDDTSESPFRSIPLRAPYSIPLRSLYSKSFDNLFMAGRNISGSHVALSSTRVMATCATQGQAIGTAMNYCLKESVTPSALSSDKTHLQRLQQILLRQDQALLGIQNEDDKDMARSAQIKASGETSNGPASSVIDGYNRNVLDGRSHQWQADMKDNGAWIELSWIKSQKIGIIELTFDTGLNRFLRLSPELSVFQDQIRGPQPETVSDYKIEVKYKGSLVFEKQCTGNFLRKVVHTFPDVEADSIRITVQKTNGDELARIFEVRCY